MTTELQAFLFFALVTLGLGHGLLWVSRTPREGQFAFVLLETAGIGLSVFSFLGVCFDLVGVPLRPAAYVVVAALGPVGSTVDRVRRPIGRPKTGGRHVGEAACAGLLLLLLAAHFYFYERGASAYPYLEDDDPWRHAESVLYIAKEHTYNVDPALRAIGDFAFYLEPYPPTYDVIMGVLRQVHDSVYFTLKFFNALMVTLAVGFFFLFFRTYFRDVRKALFATFVLAVLPSFMSHFIWSQTLAMGVAATAMGAFLKAMSDDAWTIPAVVALASMMVTQPVVSFVFGVVVLFFVVFAFVHEAATAEPWSLATFRTSRRGLLVGAGGLAGSLLFWGPQIAKWGIGGILHLKGSEISAGWASDYALQRYTLSDVAFPRFDCRIDQATGWGLAVTIATLGAAILLALRDARRGVTPASNPGRWQDLHLLLWFFSLCYLVFAPSLGLPGWGSARSWAYLAIPVALLTTEGVFSLAAIARKRARRLETAIVVLAAIAVAATSAPAKISLQTRPWMPGRKWPSIRTGEGEHLRGVDGYLRMRDVLPRNTRVYSLCANDSWTIGFDMDASPWVPSEAAFRQRGTAASPLEAMTFLDGHRYTHLTADATCIGPGQPAGASLLARLGDTGRLAFILSDDDFVLARILPSAAAPGGH